MGQVIDFDAGQRRGWPSVVAVADADPPGWPAYPPALFEAFVLPSLALWRGYVAACAGWWLAPLGLAIGAAEGGGGPSPPRARQGSPG